MLSKSDTVFTHSTFYLSSLFFSTVFISVWHILYLTYIPFNCLLSPFKCKCSTGTHLPEMGAGLELHMCSLAWQPEEGERQMWPTLALIAGKAGHYYWPSAHMVFWERTLDVECTGKQKRQLVLSPPRDGRVCINSDQCRPVSGGLGTQTPKDAWSWTETGDQLNHLRSWYLWMGDKVPGATLNWAGRGWQGDFSLGVLEGTGFEAETCCYFQRPWW